MYNYLLVAFLIATTISFSNSAVGAPSSCREAYAGCMQRCNSPQGMRNCHQYCPAELESCKATGNWNSKFGSWTGLRRD